MKISAFILPLILSVFVGYYFFNGYSQSSIAYFLDMTFKEMPICIAFYKKQSSATNINTNNDLSLIYTNMDNPTVNQKKPKNAPSKECLDVVFMNDTGISALYSLSEPKIVDAYINGDIEIMFSKDKEVFEKQILTVIEVFLGNTFYFGWAFDKLLHVYNHWFAQYFNSYDISYDWIDLHYTESDHIISAIVDDKYMLYSHGIGYGPTIPRTAENSKYANNSRLALDLSLEQSAGNKLQFIVDECELGIGSKVLDVGGGWGSFPKFAIPLGIDVHSLTISSASFEHLQKLRVSGELNNNCGCKDINNECVSEKQCGSLTVSLMNFWELRDTELGKSMAGTLDAIVCIGSIEHLVHYERLMENAEYFLKPGGYLHVDGFASKKGFNPNYFMQKYIIPGETTALQLSKYLAAWEKSNFLMVSVHFDLQEYANHVYLMVHKFENMVRNESHPLYGKISKSSVKIFRFYLWGMIVSFHHHRIQAWRVVLQKPFFL